MLLSSENIRNYFPDITSEIYTNRKLKEIARRNKRLALPGFAKENAALLKPYVAHQFETGDILSVRFSHEDDEYYFTGICLAIKKRKFKTTNVTVTIRNIIQGIGIELVFSLFYNLAFRVRFNDYQRKDFYYNKSKL